jgi:hypothetical protein
MPPGRLLGTSTPDPYYRFNQLQGLGNAFAIAAQKMDERRARKQQREQQELERFFEAATRMPELAETWGADLKRRLGATNPEVVPIVDALAQRRQRAKEAEQAVSAYDQQLQGLEQGYQAKTAALSQMSDTLPGTPYPNIDKVIQGGEVAQLNPSLFPVMAAQNLPPTQRRAAQVALKAQGVEMPSQFSPFDDLPAEAKGLLAGQMGLLQGEPLQAIRYGAGFEQTPAAKEYQQFAIEDREDRQAAQVEDRGADVQSAIEKEATRHAHRMQEIAASKRARAAGGGRTGSREEEDEGFYPEDVEDDSVEPRRTGAAKNRTLSTEIQEMTKTAVEAYDADFKTEMEGLGTTREKGKKKQEFLKERGRRPSQAPPAMARAMEREIRRLTEDGTLTTRDEVDQAALAMASLYAAATSKGLTPSQALAVALGKEPLQRKSQLQASPPGALQWPKR